MTYKELQDKIKDKKLSMNEKSKLFDEITQAAGNQQISLRESVSLVQQLVDAEYLQESKA